MTRASSEETYPSNGFPFFSSHTDRLRSRGDFTFSASVVVTVADTQKLEKCFRVVCKMLGQGRILLCELLNECLNERGILPDHLSELLDLGVGSQGGEIETTRTTHTAHATHTAHTTGSGPTSA